MQQNDLGGQIGRSGYPPEDRSPAPGSIFLSLHSLIMISPLFFAALPCCLPGQYPKAASRRPFKDAEVVAAEMDAGLQAPRARPDYDAVEEFLGAYAGRSFHRPVYACAIAESLQGLFPTCRVKVQCSSNLTGSVLLPAVTAPVVSSVV